MQPATIDPTMDLCTRYPLRLGGLRQCGIWFARHFYTLQALLIDVSRCSSIQSNTLSTWPRAPTVTSKSLLFQKCTAFWIICYVYVQPMIYEICPGRFMLVDEGSDYQALLPK